MESPTKENNSLFDHTNHLQKYRQNLSFGNSDTATAMQSESQNVSSLFGTDSGYTSYANFTSSGSFNSLSSTSYHQSSLEPIMEGIETQSFTGKTPELTPTTKNIKKILAFHITTPKSPSPVKRTASMRSIDTTPAKSRKLTLSNSTNVTPHKPKSVTKHRPDSFMHKLDDFKDDDSENCLNFSEKIEFSPIIGSLSTTQQNNQRMLQRNNSGDFMQASTPINWETINRFKGNTVAKTSNVKSKEAKLKTHSLRKTQSFSPSKHFKAKYGYSQGSVVKNVVLKLPTTQISPYFQQNIPDDTTTTTASNQITNPARKLLNFNCETFESILQPKKPTISRQNAISSDVELSDTSLPVNIGRKNVLLSPPNSQNVEMDICEEMILDQNHTLEDRSIQDTKYQSNCSINNSKNVDLHLNVPIVPESPPTAAHRYEIRTPKKILRTCSLYDSSPRREQNNILYSNSYLPCTPPKSQSKIRLLKRNANTPLKCESQAKRKLYETKKMCGYEKMDIIGRLEHVKPALDIIFKNVSNKDLINVSLVSRRWRRIIESHVCVSGRMARYSRKCKVYKENLEPIIGAIGTKQQIKRTTQAVQRKPFSRCNSIIKTTSPDRQISPETSPSNRAFHDHQKVIEFIF